MNPDTMLVVVFCLAWVKHRLMPVKCSTNTIFHLFCFTQQHFSCITCLEIPDRKIRGGLMRGLGSQTGFTIGGLITCKTFNVALFVLFITKCLQTQALVNNIVPLIALCSRVVFPKNKVSLSITLKKEVCLQNHYL